MARIALNARLLISGKLEGTGRFTDQCYKRIIASRPDDQFLLIFDRTPGPEFNYGINTESVRLYPPARRPWLFDIWFDYSVAWKLKQWRADAFISTDGYLSRRTDVPQFNVIHDINFEHHPEWLPSRFSKHFRSRFPVYANIAEKLCTVSEFSKTDISERYKIYADGITVIPNAPDKLFQPLGIEEKKFVKGKYTKGKPYHIFVGSLHPRKNIKGILSAHKEYRKLGGTAELLIVGAPMWNDEKLMSDHVHWAGRLNDADLVLSIGGAQALLYLPFFEGFGVPIVEAMASGVPVICSNKTAIPEVCGGAEAALVDPLDAVSAAEALFKLDNDIDWYTDRVNAGIRRAAEFNWDKSAMIFSNAIDEMLNIKA